MLMDMPFSFINVSNYYYSLGVYITYSKGLYSNKGVLKISIGGYMTEKKAYQIGILFISVFLLGIVLPQTSEAAEEFASCSDCGGGWFDTNFCDQQECLGLGDCYSKNILGVVSCYSRPPSGDDDYCIYKSQKNRGGCTWGEYDCDFDGWGTTPDQ